MIASCSYEVFSSGMLRSQGTFKWKSVLWENNWEAARWRSEGTYCASQEVRGKKIHVYQFPDQFSVHCPTAAYAHFGGFVSLFNDTPPRIIEYPELEGSSSPTPALQEYSSGLSECVEITEDCFHCVRLYLVGENASFLHFSFEAKTYLRTDFRVCQSHHCTDTAVTRKQHTARGAAYIV